MTIMYSFVESSDLQARDCWIGLRRTSGDCTCDGTPTEDCESCRASWSWSDGTTMSWWNWLEEEPDGSGDCGRLTEHGWAEEPCSQSHRFICVRGREVTIYAKTLYSTITC